MLRPTDYVIDDATPIYETRIVTLDGERKAFGLTPRDYSIQPREFFDSPSDLPTFSAAEKSERLAELIARKALLSDIRDWPSLDQNKKGYCWAHSTTSAVMLVRTKNNLPYVRLSAFAIACKIKNFRDEGGWAGLSAQFHRERGCPSVALWPEKSMERANDNEAAWADAARHKVVLDWVDLSKPVYNQNLTIEQRDSSLLLQRPGAFDFNWWSHSVCGIDLVDGKASFDAGLLRVKESGKLMTIDDFDLRWAVDLTGGYAPRILNSWGDSYGDRGTAVLAGTKGVPDGAISIGTTLPSAV